MKTKINIKPLYIVLCGFVLSFTGCKDYLTEIEPGTTLIEDFYTSTPAAVQNITACYSPLQWEYNNTYCSVGLSAI